MDGAAPPARELIRASALYSGAPYAAATVVRRGDTVFTAGACPLDDAGTVVEPGDPEAQMRRALANLRIALEAAGCGLGDVVKSTVFAATSDREVLTAVWRVVEETFGRGGPPSTLLGVTVLGWPAQLVEIEAVAVCPADGRPVAAAADTDAAGA